MYIGGTFFAVLDSKMPFSWLQQDQSFNAETP